MLIVNSSSFLLHIPKPDPIVLCDFHIHAEVGSSEFERHLEVPAITECGGPPSNRVDHWEHITPVPESALAQWLSGSNPRSWYQTIKPYSLSTIYPGRGTALSLTPHCNPQEQPASIINAPSLLGKSTLEVIFDTHALALVLSPLRPTKPEPRHLLEAL